MSSDMEVTGGCIKHPYSEKCRHQGPHLPEDCGRVEDISGLSTGTVHDWDDDRREQPEVVKRAKQEKSSNPKDILARDEQRVLLSYIPSPGLIYTALAMMDGARKYGPYNWRDEGVGAHTYISAAKRHLRDWLDGEEDAPDSGVHHLGHAAACLMILMDAQAVGNLVDDRPPPAPTSEMMESVKETGGVE